MKAKNVSTFVPLYATNYVFDENKKDILLDGLFGIGAFFLSENGGGDSN